MDSMRIKNMRPRSLSWSNINPEERNILTANLLSVQNQKVRKDLHVINKGIENEKRCGNATRAKEEIIIQNRKNRLNKASERLEMRTRASLTYFNFDNIKEELLKDTFYVKKPKSPSRLKSNIETNKSDDRRSMHDSPLKQDMKKKVHFNQTELTNKDGGDTCSPKGEQIKKPASADLPRGIRSSREDIQFDSNRALISRGSAEDSFTSKSEDFKFQKNSSPLDYYNANLMASMNRRLSKGFSHNAASFHNTIKRNSLNQITGLEEEMQRWRRLSHTRVMNTRLKAVRPGGRRHSSNMTLKEVMDHNNRMRKDLAVQPEPFGPDRAWEMLNCRYLRLTDSNVETLEKICKEAGYDVTGHPHIKPKMY